MTTQCGDLPLWFTADETGLERIPFAVRKLSAGDLGRLERAVRAAQVDWRDLLGAAGFPHSATVHESWLP